jgi:hypothetical protein
VEPNSQPLADILQSSADLEPLPDSVPNSDDNRDVDLANDCEPILTSQTSDDTDRGWGERSDSNDDRLREDRPPHWG